VAFVVKEFNGVLHFLVQGKVEVGNFDVVEMAATVQCVTGSYRDASKNECPVFLDQVLCLAEATVWSFHPQFQAALQLLTEQGQRVTRVNARFSFPPLAKENFRNQPELGGGCVLDLGPYAASCGRLFFPDPPLEILARITSRQPESGLETAFSLLATYPDGGALTGHFGSDTEYRNSISVLGPALALDFERAFTTPPDSAVQLAWRSRNQSQVLACPPGDSFALFLEAVVDSIRRREWSPFSIALLRDARFIEQLKRATSAGAGRDLGFGSPS